MHTLPPAPELLKKAGLDWRLAEPGDLLRIVSDWFQDGKEDFFAGKQNPFPRLARTIENALLTWKAGRPGCESAHRLLTTIYQTEKHTLIHKALSEHRPLVIFAADEPSMIVAWGHPELCYTRWSCRGQGLEDEMRRGLTPA